MPFTFVCAVLVRSNRFHALLPLALEVTVSSFQSSTISQDQTHQKQITPPPWFFCMGKATMCELRRHLQLEILPHLWAAFVYQCPVKCHEALLEVQNPRQSLF